MLVPAVGDVPPCRGPFADTIPASKSSKTQICLLNLRNIRRNCTWTIGFALFFSKGTHYWSVLPKKKICSWLELLKLTFRFYGRSSEERRNEAVPWARLRRCGKREIKVIKCVNGEGLEFSSLLQWQCHVYLGMVSRRPKLCAVPISTSKPGPRNRCQKFPRKWLPYGLNQNKSLALSEFIRNCWIFVDCTVVWLHACLNVFVLQLAPPSKVIFQSISLPGIDFRQYFTSHSLDGVWRPDSWSTAVSPSAAWKWLPDLHGVVLTPIQTFCRSVSGFSEKKKIIGAVQTNLSGSCFMHQCWLSVCFCHWYWARPAALCLEWQAALNFLPSSSPVWKPECWAAHSSGGSLSGFCLVVCHDRSHTLRY